MFAYELRKADVFDKYTYELLNGCVKPCSLVDIICSNKWMPVQGRMVVDSKKAFRIQQSSTDKVMAYQANKSLTATQISKLKNNLNEKLRV